MDRERKLGRTGKSKRDRRKKEEREKKEEKIYEKGDERL